MRYRRALPWLGVVVGFAVLMLPFVDQAFHVDDPNFLLLSRQFMESGLRLYDLRLNWGGTEERAFDILANPPLGPAYLALLIRVFGLSERVLHLGMWPFLLMAGAAVWTLGRRFPLPGIPASAVVTVMVAPALILPAHTVMPDLPLVATYLGGVAMVIYGLDSRRWSFLLAGALLGGCSALFRYSGMTIIPLIAGYAWLHRRPIRPGLVALLVLSTPTILWSMLSYHLYGRVHWMAMTGFEGDALTWLDVGHKLLYQWMGIGLTILPGIALMDLALTPAGGRDFRVRVAAGIVAMASMGVCLFLGAEIGVALLTGWGALGGTLLLGRSGPVVVSLGRTVRGRPLPPSAADDLFLALWAGGVVLFNLYLLFASVRYLILAVLPLVFLYVRLRKEGDTGVFQIWAAPVLTAGLTLLLSRADLQLANGYREVVAALPAAPQPAAFLGHWGLQHYLEPGGARALSSSAHTLPERGSSVISAGLPWPQDPPPGLRLERAQVIPIPGSAGLRTISADPPACFYSSWSSVGPRRVWLPFAFSQGPLDEVVVWKVVGP